jgi:phosphoribosylaminoimidazole-succinocarboxamide synthase
MEMPHAHLMVVPGAGRGTGLRAGAHPCSPWPTLCGRVQSAKFARGRLDRAIDAPLPFAALMLQCVADLIARASVKEPGRPMDFLKPRLTPMNRRRRIYEGKAKVLYEGPEPGTLIQHFKDDATAFNAKKHQVIDGKGVLNNRISEYIFQHLNNIGVPTHFIRRLNMREQLIKEVEIIPLEVVVRNVAAGSLATRLGIEEGTQLPRSIIEFYYKNDGLNDPMVSEEHITAFGWASPQEIDDIMALAIRVNDFLSGLFLGVGIRLVDFKMETGRLWEGDLMRIVVADEISPDSCRLWDVKSSDKMDKDRFRRDLGGLVEAYTEVARRLGIMQENDAARTTGPQLVQ